MLKNQFVCGYHNIANERYAGASGKHAVDGNAVDTSNGAGTHNTFRSFVLSADGIVLTCLPGYWHSQDLAEELKLAQNLNQVWNDPSLSRSTKDAYFRQMQLGHISQHSQGEKNRSRMQGFDIQYEITHRLYNSDVFYDPRLVDVAAKKAPPQAVKTTDVIMHRKNGSATFRAIRTLRRRSLC